MEHWALWQIKILFNHDSLVCVCVCVYQNLFLHNIYTYEFIKYWFRFKFNKPIKHVKDIESILFGVFIKYLLTGINEFNDSQRMGM